MNCPFLDAVWIRVKGYAPPHIQDFYSIYIINKNFEDNSYCVAKPITNSFVLTTQKKLKLFLSNCRPEWPAQTQ